jgi:hypothetical protein
MTEATMTHQASKNKKGLPPEHYIFDSVIGSEELLWIYHKLLSTNAWSLTRTSSAKAGGSPFMSFPGLNVETRGSIHVDFWSGYFRSTIFRVRALAKKEFNVILPPNIRRIHVGAKSSHSKTEFHVDSDEKNVWTILGFLNPIWNTSDGGEFFLEEHKIEYKAGRFVVFPSNISHDGGYVRNEKLTYWRVAVNIILDNGESVDQ